MEVGANEQYNEIIKEPYPPRQILIYYGGNLNEKENNVIYINNYGADDGIFTRRL